MFLNKSKGRPRGRKHLKITKYRNSKEKIEKFLFSNKSRKPLENI